MRKKTVTEKQRKERTRGKLFCGMFGGRDVFLTGRKRRCGGTEVQEILIGWGNGRIEGEDISPNIERVIQRKRK